MSINLILCVGEQWGWVVRKGYPLLILKEGMKMKIKDLQESIIALQSYVEAVYEHNEMECARMEDYGLEIYDYLQMGYSSDEASSAVNQKYEQAETAELERINRNKPVGIPDTILDKCVDLNEISPCVLEYLIRKHGDLSIDTDEELEEFVSLYKKREKIQNEIECITNIYMSSLRHQYSVTMGNAQDAAKKLSWLEPEVIDYDIQFDKQCSIGSVCHALSNCYPDGMIVGREAGTDVICVWEGGKRIEY